MKRIRRGFRAIGRLIGMLVRLPVALAADLADEIVVALGVALVTYGLWPEIGRLALLVPGVVLVWIGLPARSRFFLEPRPRRRDG